MQRFIMKECVKHGRTEHEVFGDNLKYCLKCLAEDDKRIDEFIAKQRLAHPEVADEKRRKK